MVVDLRWRDAMRVCGGFTAVEREAGWPETLSDEQLAILQRPWARGDHEGRKATEVLRAHIVASCENRTLLGELTIIQNQHPVQPRFEVKRAFPVSNAARMYVSEGRITGDGWRRVRGDLAPTPERAALPPVERKTCRVNAPDFAAWLHAIRVEPSPHIAAWFDVRGVAWPHVSVNVAAAPASPFPLPDFAALVAFRKANTKGEGKGKKGPSWALGNQIDVAKAELSRRISAGTTESEALNAMGRDLGIGGAEPRTPLKKALYGERKRSNPIKTPAPLPSVIAVRDGKKAA